MKSVTKCGKRVYRSCRLRGPHPAIDCIQCTREKESIPMIPSMNGELASDPQALCECGRGRRIRDLSLRASIDCKSVILQII